MSSKPFLGQLLQCFFRLFKPRRHREVKSAASLWLSKCLFAVSWLRSVFLKLSTPRTMSENFSKYHQTLKYSRPCAALPTVDKSWTQPVQETEPVWFWSPDLQYSLRTIDLEGIKDRCLLPLVNIGYAAQPMYLKHDSSTSVLSTLDLFGVQLCIQRLDSPQKIMWLCVRHEVWKDEAV